jgi:hypothetical protein
MRTFETGATRGSEEGKNDYDGFLSPLVIESYGDYMTKYRTQEDGSVRDSDNWQKGIPRDQYRKSAWRHFFEWWAIGRGYPRFDKDDGHEITQEEAANALLFNVMGHQHELLKEQSVYRSELYNHSLIPPMPKGWTP